MDLIDRDELLKKQTTYYDYNGEKVGVVRVSDIVEAHEVEVPRVAYLCDRKAKCRDGLACGRECMHTFDITHAVNFCSLNDAFFEKCEYGRNDGTEGLREN